MAKYEYNLMEAYAAAGRARMALLDRRREGPVPDPPPRQDPAGNQVRLVARIASGAQPDDYEPQPLDPINQSSCDACRHMLQGGGHTIKVVREGSEESDYTYLHSHWDKAQLVLHGRSGCALCFLIAQKLIEAGGRLGFTDKTPLLYDYGIFNTYHDGGTQVPTFAIIIKDFSGESLMTVTLTLQGTGTVPGLQSLLEAAAFEPKDGSSIEISSTRDAVRLIAPWCSDCTKNHSCARNGESGDQSQKQAFVPSRLIEVGHDTTCRLVTSKDVPPGAEYLTLSHCWGAATDHSTYSLTTDRVLSYSQNIPLDSLPLTFLEAFMVTSMLGHRYIWIDSLCIVQDSKSDWAHESALMWEVYSNSHLNISATASADGTQGLTRRRTALSVQPLIVQIPDTHPQISSGQYVCYSELEWQQKIDQGPVNTRAWVLQERLLAPRIVHFARGEVYWECKELKASERFPAGLPTAYASDAAVDIFPDSPSSAQTEYVPFQALLTTWEQVISRYSRLDLTYASDKLVAISALAKQTSLAWPKSGRYLCGLWEGPLLAQLCWYSAGTCRRAKEYRAPSWSWACLDGPIRPNFDYNGYEPYGTKAKSRSVVKVKSVSVTPANPNNQYGSATSGSLTVSGPVLRAKLKRRERPKRQQPTSAAAKRADWTKTMEGFQQLKDEDGNPRDYTGETLQVHENSRPDGTLVGSVGIDIQNGIMFIDGSADDPNPDRKPEISLGTHGPAINFDTEEDWELVRDGPGEVFLLPVSCISENFRAYNEESGEINSLGCLVLLPDASRGEQSAGVYRRVGVCEIAENPVAELFACLGNQDVGAVPCQEVCEEPLSLDDIVPRDWPCKELEFIPKEFTCFTITII